MRLSLISLIALSLAAGCSVSEPVARPMAVEYTHAVPVNQVQDAAFWNHPTDPGKSLLLVTNETRGLEVHDTAGYLLKLLPEAANPQYVDVAYNVAGRDLALVSCDDGVKVFAIDPGKRKLSDVTAGGAFLKTFDDIRPLGLFCYSSRATGRSYFFVTEESGRIQQHELHAASDGQIFSTLVRSFTLPGKSKGGSADNDLGVVYLSEDKTGIWRFPAEPDVKPDGALVIKLNEHDLIPHARGPVLYRASATAGYLLVTSQGAKGGHACVKVYDRQPPHRFLGTIDPSAAGLGPLDHSSGLDVTSAPFGPRFPHGALAVNDQDTPSGNEDFKLYSWSDIASKLHLQTATPAPARPSTRPALSSP